MSYSQLTDYAEYVRSQQDKPTALGSATDAMQSGMYSGLEFAAREAGFNSVSDWAKAKAASNLEQSQRYVPTGPQRIEEIGREGNYAKDTLDYLGNIAIQQAPILGTMIGGATAGGLMGGAPGALAGAVATTAPMHLGEAYNKQKAKNIDNPNAVWGAAGANTLLDVIPVGVAINTARKLGGGALAKAVAQGAVAEGTIEATQGAITDYAANIEPSLEKDYVMDRVNEAVAGSLMGGTVTGATHLGASAAHLPGEAYDKIQSTDFDPMQGIKNAVGYKDIEQSPFSKYDKTKRNAGESADKTIEAIRNQLKREGWIYPEQQDWLDENYSSEDIAIIKNLDNTTDEQVDYLDFLSEKIVSGTGLNDLETDFLKSINKNGRHYIEDKVFELLQPNNKTEDQVYDEAVNTIDPDSDIIESELQFRSIVDDESGEASKDTDANIVGSKEYSKTYRRTGKRKDTGEKWDDNDYVLNFDAARPFYGRHFTRDKEAADKVLADYNTSERREYGTIPLTEALAREVDKDLYYTETENKPARAKEMTANRIKKTAADIIDSRRDTPEGVTNTLKDELSRRYAAKDYAGITDLYNAYEVTDKSFVELGDTAFDFEDRQKLEVPRVKSNNPKDDTSSLENGFLPLNNGKQLDVKKAVAKKKKQLKSSDRNLKNVESSALAAVMAEYQSDINYDSNDIKLMSREFVDTINSSSYKQSDGIKIVTKAINNILSGKTKVTSLPAVNKADVFDVPSMVPINATQKQIIDIAKQITPRVQIYGLYNAANKENSDNAAKDVANADKIGLLSPEEIRQWKLDNIIKTVGTGIKWKTSPSGKSYGDVTSSAETLATTEKEKTLASIRKEKDKLAALGNKLKDKKEQDFSQYPAAKKAQESDIEELQIQIYGTKKKIKDLEAVSEYKNTNVDKIYADEQMDEFLDTELDAYMDEETGELSNEGLSKLDELQESVLDYRDITGYDFKDYEQETDFADQGPDAEFTADRTKDEPLTTFEQNLAMGRGKNKESLSLAGNLNKKSKQEFSDKNPELMQNLKKANTAYIKAYNKTRVKYNQGLDGFIRESGFEGVIYEKFRRDFKDEYNKKYPKAADVFNRANELKDKYDSILKNVRAEFNEFFENTSEVKSTKPALVEPKKIVVKQIVGLGLSPHGSLSKPEQDRINFISKLANSFIGVGSNSTVSRYRDQAKDTKGITVNKEQYSKDDVVLAHVNNKTTRKELDKTKTLIMEALGDKATVLFESTEYANNRNNVRSSVLIDEVIDLGFKYSVHPDNKDVGVFTFDEKYGAEKKKQINKATAKDEILKNIKHYKSDAYFEPKEVTNIAEAYDAGYNLQVNGLIDIALKRETPVEEILHTLDLTDVNDLHSFLPVKTPVKPEFIKYAEVMEQDIPKIKEAYKPEPKPNPEAEINPPLDAYADLESVPESDPDPMFDVNKTEPESKTESITLDEAKQTIKSLNQKLFEANKSKDKDRIKKALDALNEAKSIRNNLSGKSASMAKPTDYKFVEGDKKWHNYVDGNNLAKTVKSIIDTRDSVIGKDTASTHIARRVYKMLSGSTPIYLLNQVPAYITEAGFTMKPDDLAVYNPREDMVVIRESIPNEHALRIIIHEAIHAVTFNALETYNDGNPISKRIKDLGDEITKIQKAMLDYYKNKPEQMSYDYKYATKDVHEFMAVALTDMDVMKAMHRVPYKRKTLANHFADTIRKFLGIKSSGENAFNAMLNISGEVFKEAKLLNEVSPGMYTSKTAPPIDSNLSAKSETPNFDELPSHKEGQKTKVYAGIGSRQTPRDILSEMTRVAAYLEKLGYKLQSGHADGADKAFEDGVVNDDNKQIFLASAATDRTRAIARELHPAPQYLKPYPLNLMARNTNQVFGENLDSPVDFVIAWTPDGVTGSAQRSRRTGGTGQAIDMASRKGIPVINMANSNWRQEIRKLVDQPEKKAKAQKLGTLSTLDRVTSTIVRNNPDTLYIFGDNQIDQNRKVSGPKSRNGRYVPTSTQAVIRGFPNALGINTKINRGTSVKSYFTDADLPSFERHLEEVKARIYEHIDEGKPVVFPADGVGTGKAQLATKAPALKRALDDMMSEFIKTETHSQPNRAARLTTKPETKPETKPKPESKPETKPETKPESSLSARDSINAELDSLQIETRDILRKINANMGGNNSALIQRNRDIQYKKRQLNEQLNALPKDKPKPKPAAKPKPKPKTETKPKPEPKPKTAPKTETKTKTKTETKTETETKTVGSTLTDFNKLNEKAVNDRVSQRNKFKDQLDSEELNNLFSMLDGLPGVLKYIEKHYPSIVFEDVKQYFKLSDKEDALEVKRLKFIKDNKKELSKTMENLDALFEVIEYHHETNGYKGSRKDTSSRFFTFLKDIINNYDNVEWKNKQIAYKQGRLDKMTKGEELQRGDFVYNLNAELNMLRSDNFDNVVKDFTKNIDGYYQHEKEGIFGTYISSIAVTPDIMGIINQSRERKNKVAKKEKIKIDEIIETKVDYPDGIPTVLKDKKIVKNGRIPHNYPIVPNLGRVVRNDVPQVKYIKDLIADGYRTATTRSMGSMIPVGSEFTVPGVEGKYRVTRIQKVGNDAESWSKLEGWAPEAFDKFGYQVTPKSWQMVFERIDKKPTPPTKPRSKPEPETNKIPFDDKEYNEQATPFTKSKAGLSMFPNIQKFGKSGGPSMSTGQTQALANEYLKDLGITAKIVDGAEALRLAKRLGIEDAEFGMKFGSLHGFASAKPNANGSYDVYVNPAIQGKIRNEILEHELGHVIMYGSSLNPSSKEASAILDQFISWLNEQNKDSTLVTSLIKSKKSPQAALLYMQQVGSGLKMKDLPDNMKSYLLSFDEWFADQAGKALSRKTKPRTTVQQFFAKLVSMLKKIFGVNDKVERFIDTLKTKHQIVPIPGNLTPELASLSSDFYYNPDTRDTWDKAVDSLKNVFLDKDYNLRNLGKGKIEAFKELADLMFKPRGNQEVDNSYWHNKLLQLAKYDTRATEIMRGATESVQNKVMRELYNEKLRDNYALQRTVKIRNLFRDLKKYMESAGIEVPSRKNYFPQIVDPEYTEAHHDDFIEMMERYPKEMEAIARKWNDDVRKKAAFLQQSVDPNDLVTKEEIPQQLYQNIVRGDLMDEVTSEGQQTPHIRFLKHRIIDFLKGDDKDNWNNFYLQHSVTDATSTYITQAVKRVEYTKRFGKLNEEERDDYVAMKEATGDQMYYTDFERQGFENEAKWTNKLEIKLQEAHEQGASITDIQHARDYVAAEMGTHGRDTARWLNRNLGIPMPRSHAPINSNLQKGTSAIMSAANAWVLGLSTITSLLDPIGIAVRSGSMTQSLSSMTQGIKSAVGKNRTELEVIAEAVGSISDVATKEALAHGYNMVNMTPTMRKMNDKFFRLIGLEQWTKTTRLMAVDAAQGFIKRHDKKPTSNSSRFLKELGLKEGDVKYGTNGKVKVLTYEEHKAASEQEQDRDNRIKSAIAEFVDTSILRPSPSQRPAWASDPHFALLFHLKSFMYSFQKTILNPMWREAVKHKNFAPLLAVAMYVPAGIAIGLIKDLFKTFGDDEDDWTPDLKENWGVGDYMMDGVEKSGLTGIFQPLFDMRRSNMYGGTWAGGLFGPALEPWDTFNGLPIPLNYTWNNLTN